MIDQYPSFAAAGIDFHMDAEYGNFDPVDGDGGVDGDTLQLSGPSLGKDDLPVVDDRPFGQDRVAEIFGAPGVPDRGVINIIILQRLRDIVNTFGVHFLQAEDVGAFEVGVPF